MFNSIEVRNAEKCYGKGDDRRKILDGLDMNVKPGSIYSLIGASGCGKTTLLSCILGMKSLDAGTIKVLGHKVKYEKPPKVAHLIGYMPQNTSLIPELTIRETLYYFGNIFQMKEKVLKERYKMITDLLELPFENRRVQNLSGGQQRRVSIAASIIHNPLVLILDEPTVGLDSLLRDKIWNFLLDATRKSKLSVIITTHYISEAEKSDRCGLMRDGRFLKEDSPRNIIASCEAKSLDEAFLNLCLLKYDGGTDLKAIENENVREEVPFVEELSNTVEPFEKRKKFSSQTISTLLKKEFLRISRQPGEIFFIFIIPILQMMALSYGIGGNPIGLKLGIVNNEQLDFINCTQYLVQNVSNLDIYGNCAYNEKSSCHFLNEIHSDDVVKVFYNSHKEAYEDAKNGLINGVVTLSENFTEILHNFGSPDAVGKSAVNIQLDQSKYHLSMFLSYRLLRAYQRFNKMLSSGCGYNEKIRDVPINFDDTLYGSLDNNFRETILSPAVMQMLLFSTMGFSCFSIAQSRIDGVWNRTLLAGVKAGEIFITQVLLSFIVVMISFGETVITAVLTMDLVMIGHFYLLFVFGFLLCLAGSVFGIALSAIHDDLKFHTIILFGMVQLFTVLSGSIWPIEGQPAALQYFSFTLPTTLPSISLRNVMLKGYGITHPSVYIGIIVLSLWVLLSSLFALFSMKMRKFSQT